MPSIPNSELKSSDIPVEASSARLGLFAASFDGYTFCGTIAECALLSQKVEKGIAAGDTGHLTLSELRAALFLYFRTLRHAGQEADEALLARFLTLIRERVAAGHLD